MKLTGIICEYNPLHLGHKKQLDAVRAMQGEDSGIVCLMSGNYVQRGAPAIIDKTIRARAAVLCGADLVLELPVNATLCSAEGFAATGVGILSKFCQELCFGAETADLAVLMDIADTLLSDKFSAALKVELEKGCSFPAARQAALEALGKVGSVVSKPNNILAVEYCKAILRQGCDLMPLPISRGGSYHDTIADEENPSATAIRALMADKKPWERFVPKQAADCFQGAAIHTVAAGERAILSRLRTMTDEEFQALPYGSEGLWRKLMHACRCQASLDGIIDATKSKRYTRTRLDRMIMCAFLGITDQMLSSPAPYVRVLALNDRGREILKSARSVCQLPNTGEQQDHPYQASENRWDSLYGLFSQEQPDPPDSEEKRRVCYIP